MLSAVLGNAPNKAAKSPEIAIPIPQLPNGTRRAVPAGHTELASPAEQHHKAAAANSGCHNGCHANGGSNGLHIHAAASSSCGAPTTPPRVEPPYIPRPRPQQTWVHSCCSIAKLERALANPDVSAIEGDIMYGFPPDGHGSGSSGDGQLVPHRRVPVMAHPTWRLRDGQPELPPDVDLTFAEFLERCLSDGTRHLKLDFKELDAVEPCLELLAEKWPQLQANGQAIWLNADILPGPNARKRGACRVPAYRFLPLCRRYCPHAVLSLGWRVGPLGPEETYSPHDLLEMERVLNEFNIPGAAVVFASSVRLSERCIPALGGLLQRVPEAQLLLWTGTGELPILEGTKHRIQRQLSEMGHGARIGFDAQVAKTCIETSGAGAIDCSFYWSRFFRTRLLCCCAAAPGLLTANGLGSITNGYGSSLGERQPLVIERTNGALTPNPVGPTPTRLHSNQSPGTLSKEDVSLRF